MVKGPLLILTVTFSLQAVAEILKERVHSIVEGEGSRPHLIRFENGRVAYTRSTRNLNDGDMIEAKLEGESNLVSFKHLGSMVPKPLWDTLVAEPSPPPFEPSILGSMNEANAMFARLNPEYKRVSECSDRAHVWAYEEFMKNGLKSEKVFIFFTASYINRHHFKWWFHVAPLVSVKTGNGVEKMVLDYRYKSAPVTVKEWSDLLVYSKRPCKVTTKFSEYDVNPQTEDCYLIYESMYYRLPGDIHAQELQGLYRTDFNQSEIRASYKMGFKTMGELP